MRFILRILKHFDEQSVPGCFLTTHAKDKSFTYSFNAPANVHKEWNYFKHNQSEQGFRIFLTQFSLQTISGYYALVSHLDGRNGLNRVSIFGCNQLLRYFTNLSYCFGLKFLRLSAGSFQQNEYDYIGMTSNAQIKQYFDIKPRLPQQSTFPNKLRDIFKGEQLNSARDNIHFDSTSLPYYEDDAVRIYAINTTPNASRSDKETYQRYCYHLTDKDENKVSIHKEKFEAEIPRQFRRQLINKGILEIDGKNYSLEDYRSTEQSAHVLFIDICTIEELHSFVKSEYYAKRTESNSLIGKVNFIVHLSPKQMLENKEYMVMMKELKAQKQLITASGYYSEQQFKNGYTPSFTFLNFNSSLASCFPAILPYMIPSYFLAWSSNRNGINTPIEQAPFFDADKIWLSRMTEQIHIKNSEIISLVLAPQTTFMHASIKQQVLKSQHALCERFKAIAEQKIFNKQSRSSSDNYPEIIPLGTSSSQSTALRNESGYFIRTSKDASILLDCGPSTFYQLSKQFITKEGKESIGKEIMTIKMIVISHHHTDHHFGIVDFLASRAALINELQLKEVPPILIVIPSSIITYLESLNTHFQNSLQAVFIPHESVTTFGAISKTKNINNDKSSSGLLLSQLNSDDSADSDQMGLDYSIFEEQDNNKDSQQLSEAVKQHQQLFKTRLQEMGIFRLVLFPIFHCHGSKSILLELMNYKKIAYSGDGRPNVKYQSFMKDVDYLIHECTFTSEFAIQARLKSHSFFDEVLQLAMDVNAKHLILSHFSTNNTIPLISKYIHNTAYSFSNPSKEKQQYLNHKTIIAFDNLVISPQYVNDLPLASRVITKMSSE